VSVLIAGFGNVFFSDDGLGACVIRMLRNEDLGEGVHVRDFGTGGMHLALEMLKDYERVIIVDALAREAPPGTVFAVDCTCEGIDAWGPPDPHGMDVRGVLSLYRRLREQLGVLREPYIIVAGCVPESLEEGMELSATVRAAVPACAALVCKLARQSAALGAGS
jgi:hydrogenase maturation protease